MDIAHLDFAKAFNKVHHERLLLKIKSMGIPEQVTLWIAAWLRDMQSKVLKFADDTKLCHRANGDEDNRVLQRDLDFATNWAKRWQVEFNVKKCKIMHIGPTNQQAVYTMGNHKLDEVEEEKDLGVNIHSSL